MTSFIPIPLTLAPGRSALKLVRFKAGGDVAWGLLADDEATLHHVAGGFRAWSPRIAGGEGANALPRTGRRHALAEVELLTPVEDGAAIYDARGGLAAGMLSVAGPRSVEMAVGVAVVGAPLAGRFNPLRSLFGYTLGWCSNLGGAAALALSPIVTTCGGLDPEPAITSALARDLTRLDVRAQLRPGDLVLFALAAGAVRPVEAPILAAVA